jgi:hypothetical protein
MKQMIEKTIDIDSLSGETIKTWIGKLLELQNEYGDCATISAIGNDNGYGGVFFELDFERLETDEEYQNRIEREEYLKQIKIKKDKDQARQEEIKKQYAEKKAELEALELELKRGY